jgi:hypothetical protein
VKRVSPGVWAVLFGLAIIAGCGGGGGGIGSTGGGISGAPLGPCAVATSPGTLLYSTTWGNAGMNSSQVIQVIDSDGFVLRSDSANRGGQVASNVTLANLAAGIHQVRALLYSGANATGTLLGESRMVLDLCSAGPGGAAVNLSTHGSLPPLGVRVSSTGLSVPQERIIQYVGTGFNGSFATFLPTNGVTWSVNGGVGTINSSGRFTATTVGTGSIQASIPSSSVTGLSTVTVTEKQITQTKWTVLVYMNAANDLFSFSDQDMNEMERVASNPNVRFVVQWKQSRDAFGGSSFDGVRRYVVKPDTTSNIQSELVQSNVSDAFGNPLDMGSPQTLRDFITWGKANYPADRYVLVLWNHGNGWRRSPDGQPTSRAFSYDDQYGTSIKTWQTDAALSGQHFDIIAWDCSLMQMLEVAYETKEYADFIAGSEESPPGEGYPYDLVFAGFRDNPDATTRNLSKGFVDGMLNHPPYVTRKITQSVIETSKLPDLAASVSTFGQQLSLNLGAVTSAVQSARSTAQSYSPTTTRVYRDLIDLCAILEANSTVPLSVKTASADVRAKAATAIVWEGHNANSANSRGVSIDFSSSATFTGSTRSDYLQLKFASDTLWDEFLSVAP